MYHISQNVICFQNVQLRGQNAANFEFMELTYKKLSFGWLFQLQNVIVINFLMVNFEGITKSRKRLGDTHP